MFKLIPTSVRIQSAKKAMLAKKTAFNARVERTVNVLANFAVHCSRIQRRRTQLLTANVQPRIVSSDQLAQYSATMTQYAAGESMRKLFYLNEHQSWSTIVVDQQERELTRILTMSDEAFYGERQAILIAYRNDRRDIRPLINNWLAISTLRDNYKRAQTLNLLNTTQLWTEVIHPVRRSRFASIQRN
jgi:hypothetical protein